MPILDYFRLVVLTVFIVLKAIVLLPIILVLAIYEYITLKFRTWRRL